MPLHNAAQGKEAEAVVSLLKTYPEGAKEKDNVRVTALLSPQSITGLTAS